MIATLPNDWFFVEPDSGISAEIFAIAVNPDYTMAAIFSQIKKTSEITEVVAKEGLIGLSRICFSKHLSKSMNSISLVDNYNILNFGNQKFGFHNFVKSNDNTYGSSAVLISGIDEYYEFSLVTMNFTVNLPPTRIEFDKTFNEILSTLVY
jgi:hypothetical protein